MRPLFLRPVAGAVLVSLLSTLAAPAAEANLWDERRVAVARAPGLPAGIADQLPGARPMSLFRAPARPTAGSSSAAARTAAALPQTHVAIREIIDSGDDAAVVVLIQDVHLNPEAQANAAKALLSLVSAGAISRIGVEGAFAAFDFSLFRGFSDQKLVVDVASDFVKGNLLAAPSFAGIASAGKPVDVVGVDDRAAYDRNVAAFRTASALQPRLREALSARRARLAAQKARLFPEALAELDALVDRHARGEAPLGAVLARLVQVAGDAPPAVVDFLEAYGLERRLDFAVVERDRRRVIERLTGKLSDAEMTSLLETTIAFRSGAMGLAAFHLRLRDLCRRKGVDLAAHPAFDAYVRYALLADRVRGDAIDAGRDALEKRAFERLATTAEQRSLLEETARLRLLEKLGSFALTSSEWKRYREGEKIPVDGVDLAGFEDFYRFADERSVAIVSRLIDGSRGMALVVGGFHTDHVAAMLQARGCSVVVCTPRLTKVDLSTGPAYLTVFTRESTPVEKLFRGERLFINPTAANVGPSPGLAARIAAEAAARTAEGESSGTVPAEVTVERRGAVVRIVVRGIEVFMSRLREVPGYFRIGPRQGREGGQFVPAPGGALTSRAGALWREGFVVGGIRFRLGEVLSVFHILRHGLLRQTPLRTLGVIPIALSLVTAGAVMGGPEGTLLLIVGALVLVNARRSLRSDRVNAGIFTNVFYVRAPLSIVTDRGDITPDVRIAEIHFNNNVPLQARLPGEAENARNIRYMEQSLGDLERFAAAAGADPDAYPFDELLLQSPLWNVAAAAPIVRAMKDRGIGRESPVPRAFAWLERGMDIAVAMILQGRIGAFVSGLLRGRWTVPQVPYAGRRWIAKADLPAFAEILAEERTRRNGIADKARRFGGRAYVSAPSWWRRPLMALGLTAHRPAALWFTHATVTVTGEDGRRSTIVYNGPAGGLEAAAGVGPIAAAVTVPAGRRATDPGAQRFVGRRLLLDLRGEDPDDGDDPVPDSPERPGEPDARRIVDALADAGRRPAERIGDVIQVLTERRSPRLGLGETTQTEAPAPGFDPRALAGELREELARARAAGRLTPGQVRAAAAVLAALLTVESANRLNAGALSDADVEPARLDDTRALDTLRWVRPDGAVPDGMAIAARWRAGRRQAGDRLILLAPAGEANRLRTRLVRNFGDSRIMVIDAAAHRNVVALLRALPGGLTEKTLLERRFRFLMRDDAGVAAGFFDLSRTSLDGPSADALRDALDVYVIAAEIMKAVKIDTGMLDTFETLRTIMIQA